jgi:hypothetical protein
MSKNRCIYKISDSKPHRCKNHIHKNFYCKIHYDIINNVNLVDNKTDTTDEYGTCCFCGDYCNPCSQSCGRCAREITMQAIGWK